jgi:hypothetical protein
MFTKKIFMKKLNFLTLFLIVLLPAFSQKASIDQVYVDHIIKTLSADEMQGRKTFEPGNEKAGNFIANEFEKIGLKPLPGLSAYHQNFKVYQVKPQRAEVKINGIAISPDKILVYSGEKELKWRNQDVNSAEVAFIRAGDSFSQKVGDLMKGKKNTLILIEDAHLDIFNKYKNYYSKGNISLEQSDGSSLVFVIHETIESPTFEITATNDIKILSSSNIAGMIPGRDKKKKEEIVIFSAHYDHIGILKPINGDSIANGADDDASGTTAVLALAKYYKKQKNNARTLIFVAFTAEEMGGYGSQYFSKQLDPDKVAAMFNIEMIGKPSKFGSNTAWITGYEKTDFGKILQQNLQGSPFVFHPDPYPEQNLFYRSDNATLARLGVPAHTISSDEIDIDKLYHSVEDEYESLNIANMTQIIKAIAQSARSIISAADSPTRVDPSGLK